MKTDAVMLPAALAMSALIGAFRLVTAAVATAGQAQQLKFPGLS